MVNCPSIYPVISMSGCSTSACAEVQGHSHQDAPVNYSNLSKTSEHPLQHKNEMDKENRGDDGNGHDDVPEEEDEDEDADFNPFLKETNSLEASSSVSSEVEDLDMDVPDSRGKRASDSKSKEEDGGIVKDCRTSKNVESGEEMTMQNTFSVLASAVVTNKESALNTQSENGSPVNKENGPTSLRDVNATGSGKTMLNLDTEDAICKRTRARYSLASFTLDELETFLQETDDEEDLQNVDDEEEYRKFLAAVLRGDDSENLQWSANGDDEDEENDADFELELEEALESEPDEVEERRLTRHNRCRKASLERNRKLSEQLSRPLRPLLPFASVGTFSTFDGKHCAPSISPSNVPPVNNGYSYGFTPHQIGQLHCLIHEHVQLLIQVFSMCVLEPGKCNIASEVKELVVQMHQKLDQALAWRTVPYPSFCFTTPYIRPLVADRSQKILSSKVSDENVPEIFPCGSSRALNIDINTMSNERHNYLPDERGGSSQTPGCTSWGPYVCGPVLSVLDVAPLRLVQNYVDDVSSAVQAYERCQIERGFETHCEKEPLFPLSNSVCSAELDAQGEIEHTSQDSGEMLSPSSSSQMPKKTMAAALLEKAKNQSIALVPKEIAKLAQRFWPLFNPALYPHKPPPAPIANRVLFTDAEDELLALGLMEYNTDWKAIQQRFLPCKSRHQIFVRQKNRASSKAPENPIKAVRRIKNSPLTPEEIARIEVGLKKFKLDWISIWRCFVPHRDPSLLPRQWRIASGTQKSYKSDPNKKAKRRLYELRRKISKPSPSTWHSSSEKEADSTDNAIEEINSGDNHMDKEDEAYVHEAFLADWLPDNNVSSSVPAGPSFGKGTREPEDNSVCGDTQPLMFARSPTALRSSNSEVILRPYRARRPNAARLVKLAPDLPPVNLPPSVRVMSQSVFKSFQAVTSPKRSGNALRISGVVVENRALATRTASNSEITASCQHQNHPEVTTDRCVVERGDSDLQMHPLLFQSPQDGDLRYYPSSTSTSSSFSFFSGKQPRLSLSLFHNPRQIRDAVNFLSKSSKPLEKNASTSDVDFHPLLQSVDDADADADAMAAHPAGRLPPTAESRGKCAIVQNPSASTSKPSLDGTTSSASGTKFTSLGGKANELDLNIRPSLTSKNQEATTRGGTGRSLCESAKDSSNNGDSVPNAIADVLNSGDTPLVASANNGSRDVSDKMQDDPITEIMMEQEELSDSEEEYEENVEFECEEMADSEGDSTSDSEQVVYMQNELDETDADIDDVRMLNTQCDYGGNTSDRHSSAKTRVKTDTAALNLNSCPPIPPYPNPKNTAGYGFGPFGTTGTFGQNQVIVDSSRNKKRGADHRRKRSKDDGTSPRKRVCRSNSSSSVCSEKGNSAQILK